MNRSLALVLCLIFCPIFCLAIPANGAQTPFNDAVVKYRSWALDYQTHGRWAEAVWAWEVASGLEPENQELATALAEARRTAAALARKQVKSGQRNLAAGKSDQAVKDLLLALYYDPEDPQALAFFQNELNPAAYAEHQIQPGETLASVARAYSPEPGAATVLAHYNNLAQDAALAPGNILRLPKLDGLQFAAIAAPAPQAQAPVPETPEQVADKPEEYEEETEPVTLVMLEPEPEPEPQVYDPEPDLARARRLLDQGSYTEAGALCADILVEAPDELRALDLANEAHYAQADIYSKQNNQEQAFEELSVVEPGYKDTAYRLAELRRGLASRHYNEGIRYFTQDELDKALEEWRRTLYYDPGHPTVRQDIAKAEIVKSRIDTLK